MSKTKLPISHTPQWDGHTCGLCAASSIYRFYGMDPDEYELRAYLGVDNILPYNFPARERIEAWLGGVDAAGTGTMPMDMLAVLYWDGFDCQTLTGRYSRIQDRLTEHIISGHPALTMLYSCLHWVVVCGIDKLGVWVVDGFFTDQDILDRGRGSHVYRLSHQRFAHESHGLILVSRQDHLEERLVNEMTYPDFIREYARGLVFGARVLGKTIPLQIRSRLGLVPN